MKKKKLLLALVGMLILGAVTYTGYVSILPAAEAEPQMTNTNASMIEIDELPETLRDQTVDIIYTADAKFVRAYVRPASLADQDIAASLREVTSDTKAFEDSGILYIRAEND